VLDDEIGHDPDTLSNGDHRTRLCRLAACVPATNQRPSARDRHAPASKFRRMNEARPVSARSKAILSEEGRPGLAVALLGSQPYDRTAERGLPSVCHS
jgi:hypothetical protein